MTIDNQQMVERFGPAISNLLETSSIQHLWRLAFLVNFFIVPLYIKLGKRYGVSRSEVQILYCLTQQPDLLAQDIALVTGQPKNTISRAVTQLVEKQFIRRETHGSDRRAKRLELTKSGVKVVKQIMPHFRTRQAAMRDVLTPQEKETFDALLSKIVYAMPDWVDGHCPSDPAGDNAAYPEVTL